MPTETVDRPKEARKTHTVQRAVAKVKRRRSLSYNDHVGSRSKEMRQLRSRQKMDARHGVVHIDREIECPPPPKTET